MTRFLYYCCCCVPLRLAAMIIGYLSILECVIVAIKCFAGIEHEMITLILITPNEPPEQIKCHGMAALCICRGLFNVIMIVLCVRLLLGISKGIPEFMELWLLAYLLVNVLDLALLLTALIWIGGYYVLFYLVLILMKFYCLFIVYRYYLLLNIPCDCTSGEDEECPYDPECPDDDGYQSEHDGSGNETSKDSSRRPSNDHSNHRQKYSHKHRRRKSDDSNRDRKNSNRDRGRHERGPNDCSDDDGRTDSSTDCRN